MILRGCMRVEERACACAFMRVCTCTCTCECISGIFAQESQQTIPYLNYMSSLDSSSKQWLGLSSILLLLHMCSLLDDLGCSHSSTRIQQCRVDIAAVCQHPQADVQGMSCNIHIALKATCRGDQLEIYYGDIILCLHAFCSHHTPRYDPVKFDASSSNQHCTQCLHCIPSKAGIEA